jgi:hypothetical protein
VTSTTGLYDKDTGNRYKPMGSCGLWLWVLIVVTPFIIGIIMLSGNNFSKGDGIIFLLVGVALLAIFIFVVYRKAKGAKNFYKLTFYRCELCGKQWKVREGEPQPPLENQANVDLVTLGAKKLEEEEAERKRKEQEAAALYYLSHKK